MVDLKNKILDIFFEDEDEENVVIEKKQKTVVEKQNVETSEPSIKAKDLLYRKAGSSSAFIDLVDSPKVSDEFNKENAPYEMSSQISPIFGLVNQESKKVNNVDTKIRDAQVNKPNDLHLDIITSPIYGYGKKEELLNDDSYFEVNNELVDEDDQLHNLFDDNKENIEEADTLKDDEEISLFKLFGEDK